MLGSISDNVITTDSFYYYDGICSGAAKLSIWMWADCHAGHSTDAGGSWSQLCIWWVRHCCKSSGRDDGQTQSGCFLENKKARWCKDRPNLDKTRNACLMRNMKTIWKAWSEEISKWLLKICFILRYIKKIKLTSPNRRKAHGAAYWLLLNFLP